MIAQSGAREKIKNVSHAETQRAQRVKSLCGIVDPPVLGELWRTGRAAPTSPRKGFGVKSRGKLPQEGPAGNGTGRRKWQGSSGKAVDLVDAQLFWSADT